MLKYVYSSRNIKFIKLQSEADLTVRGLSGRWGARQFWGLVEGNSSIYNSFYSSLIENLCAQ